MKKRLGVNIDHVATLRNARGEKHHDPYTLALDVLKAGADSITVHLREDRRHINDIDLKILSSKSFLTLESIISWLLSEIRSIISLKQSIEDLFWNAMYNAIFISQKYNF